MSASVLSGSTTAGGVDASGGSISVNPPTGLASGDLWMIGVTVDTNAAGTEVVNLPAGWSSAIATQIADPTGQKYPASRVIYKQAGAGEAAVTITFSSGTFFNAAYANIRIGGYDTATPIDGTPQTSTVTSDTGNATPPSASVSANGSLGLTFQFAQNNDLSAPPSGLSTIGTLQNNQFPTLGAAYQSVDSGTWAPGSWSNSGDRYTLVTIIIKSDGAAAPTQHSLAANFYRMIRGA